LSFPLFCEIDEQLARHEAGLLRADTLIFSPRLDQFFQMAVDKNKFRVLALNSFPGLVHLQSKIHQD
jgi:hypothetical protein